MSSGHDITVIILTHNEEIHIERAIQSVSQIAREIIIIDSYSTDRTIEICNYLGARVIQHKFINQAEQLRWMLQTVPMNTAWVMRLDADEYLTNDLITEIKQTITQVPENIHGLIMKRRLYFMGKWIRRGGYYPAKLLRLWRNGSAYVQKRLMDEHIVLSKGQSAFLDHDFVDENLRSLSSWIDKHNKYATREAIQQLDRVHKFLPQDERTDEHGKNGFSKRTYEHSPLFLRCLVYFCYRYFIRLGFLDGTRGLIWHGLQGLWYRFLVDAKIYQIKLFARMQKKSVADVISAIYGREYF